MKGVDSALVDTTARAVLRMKPGQEPDLDDVNLALGKRLSVKKIDKTKLAQATEVYTVKVKGLG